MQQELTIRGRQITSDDILLINVLIGHYGEYGRTFVSRKLCQEWNWRQPNGALKDMAAREILRRLEEKGFIALPASQRNWARHKLTSPSPRRVSIDTSGVAGPLKSVLPIEVRMVRYGPDEATFKALVHQYHYLGYRQIVGPHVTYMAFSQGRPLACVSWGAGAWRVGCRDSFIGWSPRAHHKNLPRIANNHRFLILPWVRIPHLASYILGTTIRLLVRDWLTLYHHPIVLLETFVDIDRFKGTCYKATNWHYVGLTQGRGKWDRDHRSSVPRKAVFLYPLLKGFRDVLCNE